MHSPAAAPSSSALRRLGVLLAVPLLALSAAGCEAEAPATAAGSPASSSGAVSAAPSAEPQAGADAGSSAPRADAGAGPAAVDVLATLPIKGRAPKTGYDREQFGQAWEDVDRNGCDTRNDILRAQLTDVVFANAGGCKVASGTLADPYTGATISFVRGQDTSTAVQIDHVVALSDAWQKGAQQLSAEQRRALANDPLNLLAVDGPTNAAKGDGDAATWLPPNRGYRCAYVARQVAVKAEYSLWVTQAEHDAMAGILAGCPGQAVPAGGAAAGTGAEDNASGAPAQEAVAPAPAVGPGTETYYPNCAAVRAAGAAPIRHGDPGYRAGLDGDGDGTGCE